MSDQFPSRSLDKIIIRVPDGMRKRIKRVADANGRSVNAELLVLLERTYPADVSIDDHLDEIAKIIASSPSERDEAWASVLEKMRKLRDESN